MIDWVYTDYDWEVHTLIGEPLGWGLVQIELTGDEFEFIHSAMDSFVEAQELIKRKMEESQ